MKKIAFVTGVIVATGGAYASNTYLVNKAAQEVPVHIQKFIDSANKDVVDIEILDTQINGKHITQEFAIYMIENGVRNSLPLYVMHNMDIGIFGLSAKGNLRLPKDKGFAKEFVENATQFTEKFDYTYTLASQDVDLISSMSFDPVENEQGERVEFGTVRFSATGNEEKNSGNLTLDSFQFTGIGTDLISIKDIELVFDNTRTRRQSDFSINKVNFSNTDTYHQTQTNIDIKDVKIVSDVTLDNKQENASVVNNWYVNDFSMKAPGFELPSSKLGFEAKIDKLNIKKLNLISEAIAAQDEERLLRLTCGFFEKGFKVSDIKVYMNDSDITGFVDVAPADYSTAETLYNAGMIVGQHINSELNIKLAKAQFAIFNIPVEMVAPLLTEQYHFTDEKDKFTGQVKIANGKTSINNVAVR